jgi:flagellar protein FlgJ
MQGSVESRFKSSAKDVDNHDEQRLQEACADFEAIMITHMLKTMKSTLSGNALFNDDGLQKDFYDSMYNRELAENIAHGKNSLGIGEMLYRQLSDSSDPADGQMVSSVLDKMDKN